MWLNVLTMLRRGAWGALLLPLLLLLAGAGSAGAANVSFNGGAVIGCTLSGSSYSCVTIPLGATDTAVIHNGYTVVVSGGFAPSYNQGLTLNGSAAVLQSSGSASIDLSNINPASVSTGGGSLIAGGSLRLGSSTTINGSVTAASFSTGAGDTITGNVTVTGLADLGSAIKINGNLNAGSVKSNSPGQIGGTITAKTTIDLGSGMSVGGSISGTTITTTAPVTLNGSVSASVAFTLASGSSVTGNISSPRITLSPERSTVKGNISTSGTLDVGSGVTITGSVDAAGLVMRASGAVINGTTKISGDVDLQAGSTINGDLSARDVTTRSGNAVINGNATLNSIYIDWNNSVTGIITCTGALNGTEPCSCVSKPQYYDYKPRCGAPPAAGAHHIQITHSGSGLTCQPQTVQLKACADANCTTTYTGATTVTLAPGGSSITFNGSGTGTVSQSSATPANDSNGGTTLSATSAAIGNANVCVNSGSGNNSCKMIFSDNGLVLSVPDHISMTPGVKLNVQALKSSPQGSCVPLVQGATVPVKFSCAYVNPLPAVANAVPVTLGTTNLSCGAGGTDVNLSFDSNGLATPALQYAEVGQTNISAAYTTGNLGASGATQFTTAPAKIKIEAARLPVNGVPTPAFSPTAFARGGDRFTIKLTALNANDDTVKNFGRETPQQNFSPQQPVLIEPTNGDDTITTGSYKRPVNGVAEADNPWRFDETGTLRFNVKLLDSSTYYLGNTSKGFNTQATVDLVFVPHHFDVKLVDGVPMDCALVGGLNNPCGPLNKDGRFVYSKQPFGVTVAAYVGTDKDGVYKSPKNYVGAAARPITLSVWNASNTTLPIPAGGTGTGDLKWGQNPPTAMPFAFTNGTAGTIGKLEGTLPSFDFRLTPTAPTTMVVRAIDSDLATSQDGSETRVTVVSGRMDIANVSGPLNAPVPVTTKAMYWNGSAYVFNAQFKLDAIPLYTTVNGARSYYISYSNCQNALDASSNNAHTCPAGAALRLAAPESMAFKDGGGRFYLAQPTPALNRNGSVDVTLINALYKDDKDKMQLLKYLPSGTGRVVFGVYRSGPVIYTREVYN